MSRYYVRKDPHISFETLHEGCQAWVAKFTLIYSWTDASLWQKISQLRVRLEIVLVAELQ